MKAAGFRAHGGVDQVVPLNVPAPGAEPGQVLVSVAACGLNHFDLMVLRGPASPGRPLPFWGGADIAGTVVAVGTGVSDLAVGDRVTVNPGLWCGRCAHCRAGQESQCLDFGVLGDEVPGGLAELVAVPADRVKQLPEGFGFEEAAALPVVFATAWRALISRGRLRAGEIAVVLGASGGVGTAAIQVARLAGARVIAITSSPEKVDQAVRLGAEVGVDRRSVDPWQAVGHITGGRGADLVLDSVGQVTWRPALERLANGGRLVTVGRTSGRLAETDVREVFWRQLEIIGSTMASQAEFDAVMDVAFAGRLRPVIDSVHSLSDAADGYRRLDSGEHFGKVIIRVTE